MDQCLYVQYSDEDMYDLAITLGYGCSIRFCSEKFLESMPRAYRFSTSSGISHLAFLTRGLAASKRTSKPLYQGRQAKDRSLREKRERSAYLYGHNLTARDRRRYKQGSQVGFHMVKLLGRQQSSVTPHP